LGRITIALSSLVVVRRAPLSARGDVKHLVSAPILIGYAI